MTKLIVKVISYYCLIFLVFLLGCSATRKQIDGGGSQEETRKEVEAALKSVAEAISGNDLSEEDLKVLSKQLREDEDAQSAVEAITDAMSNAVRKVKYCPVDGKRYSPNLETCPDHGMPLKWVEE